MKNKFPLIGTTIFSLTAIFILYYFSPDSMSDKKGFIRKFNYSRIEKLKEFDIKYDSYYISSLSSTTIYLANYTAPLHTLNISYNLNNMVHYRIPFLNNKAINWKVVRVYIDSEAIYMNDYSTSSFITSNLPHNKEIHKKVHGIKFDIVKIISNSSAIVRSYDNYLKQWVFKKIHLHKKQEDYKTYVPDTQSDGIFSLDGFLTYNKEQAKVFYISYYTNKILCLDTNMNLILTANTIDTNNTAKIKFKEISKSNTEEKLLSSPPSFVNKRGSSSNNFLYINSAIKSDNESISKFQTSSIIDVYNATDGRYLQSISIPDYKEKKIMNFAVYHDKLVALHGKYLVIYKIEFIKP